MRYRIFYYSNRKCMRDHATLISYNKNMTLVKGLGADKCMALQNEKFEQVENNIYFILETQSKDNFEKYLSILRDGKTVINLFSKFSKNVDFSSDLASSLYMKVKNGNDLNK